MDFHFILKEVKLGAVSYPVFFCLARDSYVDALESTSQIHFEFTKRSISLRPFIFLKF